jgi:hypothetical protein
MKEGNEEDEPEESSAFEEPGHKTGAFGYRPHAHPEESTAEEEAKMVPIKTLSKEAQAEISEARGNARGEMMLQREAQPKYY